MGRSPRGKSSRANNCQQARIIKDLNNQEYRRAAGTGVGGFSQEYFQNYQPSVANRRQTISPSSSSSSSSPPSSSTSRDQMISTEEVQDYSYDACDGVGSNDEESYGLFEDQSSEDEQRSIESLFHDIQSEEDSDCDNDVEPQQLRMGTSSRNERRKKAKFRTEIDSTMKTLLERGERLNLSPTKMLLKYIIDIFETELQSIIRAKMEKTTDEAACQDIIEKFRATIKGSSKRVEVASRLFDVFGNLLHFRSQRQARRSLGCCVTTFLKAKQHAIIFGPGAKSPRKTRNRATPIRDVLEELESFAASKMACRISSFQTTSTGLPVNYLSETVSALWRSYQSEEGAKIGRTMFFRYFSSEKYEKMHILGGLCSVCDSTAYTVRKTIVRLAREFCPFREKEFQLGVDVWIRHIRLQMVRTSSHIPAATHCYDFALGYGCQHPHNRECTSCLSIFRIIEDLRPLVFGLNQNDLTWVLFEDLPRLSKGFMAHRLRTSSTKQFHAQAMETLAENHAIIILDFKQKLLKESAREPQKDWYGKQAFASFHGAAILTRQTDDQRNMLQSQSEEQQVQYRKPNSRPRTVQTPRIPINVNVEYVDIVSADTSQDSRWVMNAMEIISTHLQSFNPSISTAEIWCDNAPNYHNAELSRFLPRILQMSNITLQRVSFFEAGEGKSLLDRHFAIVRHSIREKIKMGQSFERVEDVIDAVRTLSGLHCYSLVPNRIIEVPVTQDKINSISFFHDWRYEYSLETVTVRYYRQVFGDTQIVNPDYIEELAYFIPTANMMLPDMLKITQGTFQRHTIGQVRLLPSINQPKQFMMAAETLDNLGNIGQDSQTENNFQERWGQPQPSRKPRFPAIIVRALTYFFYEGNSNGGNHLSAEAVCESVGNLIRQGLINERALTHQQVKSWISLRKRQNKPRPEWIISGDPSCIWNVQAPPQQQVSTSIQVSDEPEHQNQFTDDVVSHPNQVVHDLSSPSIQFSHPPTPAADARDPHESRPAKRPRRYTAQRSRQSEQRPLDQSDRIPEVDSADTARLLQRWLASRHQQQRYQNDRPQRQPGYPTGSPALSAEGADTDQST